MSRNTLYRQIIGICGLFFLTLVFSASESPASSSEANILRQKIGQILSLREKISKNRMQAIEIQENLKGQVSVLRDEIIGEQKRLKILTYQDAKHSLRIYYDLMLVLQLHAYISELNKKIAMFSNGNAELEFLYLRADDDLKIVETLNNVKIERLMDQIDKTLRNYLSINDKYLLNANDIVLKKPIEIWNEFIQQK